jgi:hypothetical protein
MSGAASLIEQRKRTDSPSTHNIVSFTVLIHKTILREIVLNDSFTSLQFLVEYYSSDP